MSWTFVYLLTRLDALVSFLLGGVLVSGSGVFVALIVYAMQYDIYGKERVEGWWPKIKKFLIVPIIFGILLTATPTTKEGVAIWLIPKIVNNEQVQKMPDKAFKLFNKKLNDWLIENDLKVSDKVENETDK